MREREAEQEAGRRERFALALVEGASIPRAGEAADISRATAYRWYGDAATRARVRELQGQAIEHARQRLRGMLGRALDTLEEVMADGSARGSHARLAAATAVLKAAGLQESGEDAAVVIVSHVPRDATVIEAGVSVRDDAALPAPAGDIVSVLAGVEDVSVLTGMGDAAPPPRVPAPAVRDLPAPSVPLRDSAAPSDDRPA